MDSFHSQYNAFVTDQMNKYPVLQQLEPYLTNNQIDVLDKLTDVNLEDIKNAITNINLSSVNIENLEYTSENIAAKITPYVFKRRLAFVYAYLLMNKKIIDLTARLQDTDQKSNKDIETLKNIISAMLQFHTEGAELELLKKL